MIGNCKVFFLKTDNDARLKLFQVCSSLYGPSQYRAVTVCEEQKLLVYLEVQQTTNSDLVEL